MILQVFVNMGDLWSYISMMSTELLFLLFFGMGFFFLQTGTWRFSFRSPPVKRKKTIADECVDVWKTVEIDSQAGRTDGVLASWRLASKSRPTPPDTLKLVVQAFLDAGKRGEKASMVQEVISHMEIHKDELCNSRAAAIVLDVVARAGEIQQMEDLMKSFADDLKIVPDSRVYDILMGGYAAAGKENKVQDVMVKLQEAGHRVGPRAFSVSIKGYLKNGMADAVLKQILSMKDAGFDVPGFAVGQLFRLSADAKRTEEFLQRLEDEVPLSADAVGILFEECCVKQGRKDLVGRIEGWARRSNIPITSGAYDWLLKYYVAAADVRALDLFTELAESGTRLNEGLCVGLLARCAEAKFLRFAERVVRHIKEKQRMSVAMYSALMKVYAFCGMYGKACDLYNEILEEGLEPDSMMYGCLIKFAVDCGRTGLAQKLFDKAPRLEVANYMALIRAAGCDGDIDRAFAILKKLQESGQQLDLAAYNCVLDVCVSLGEIDRARELIKTMRKVRPLDVITWNTLLKGFCSKGDTAGAQRVVREMEQDGHKPNDVSFNCLLNAAVSSGRLAEAWSIIGMMEKSGIPVDHFTVSILMKYLKKGKASKVDVNRVLNLLDRSRLNVYKDEILLNTVVETCIKHKETHRLQAIVSGLATSGLRPSVHTYGTIIKACSVLRRVRQCRELWHDMVVVRALVPNEITVGCMLDALVCNHCVDEAVQLMNQWRTVIPPNAVMYSTIIKGYANQRKAEDAIAMWQEMRSIGGLMNTVTYNVVIDAQARVGAMDSVAKLIECMCEDNCVPDAITNSTIVKGYCVKGDLERAMEVFNHMQAQGMVKEAIIYNTLLEGCSRHGRDDLADLLLSDMEKHRITPTNFTLGIIVKLYGRHRKLDLAREAVETWPLKYGVVANAQVWTALMCAYINEGELEIAATIFEQMKSTSLGCDAKAYGALLAGCVRKGNLLKALALLDEAHGLGASQQARGLPDDQWVEPENLEALVRAVASRQGADAAASLVVRLVGARAPLNAKTLAFAE